MALTFGGATSDRINCGNGSTVNNLDPFTVLMWVRPTTLTNGRVIWQKGRLAGFGKQLQLTGTSGNIQIRVSRAANATPLSYSTTDTPLALNTWAFVAVTFNSAGTAGLQGQIYAGTLAASATLRTVSGSDGTGTVDDDSSASDPLIIAWADWRPFPSADG